MKTFLYYLAGAVAGLGIVLGIDAAGLQISHKTPVASEAMSTSPIVPAADVQALSDEVTSSRQNAITKAAAAVSPAVVGINVIAVREYIARHPFADDPFLRQFFPDQIYKQKVENLGSGFLISPDGYVMTNEHVVHDARQVIVTTTEGEKFEAKVVGFDYDTDVAILKVEGKQFPFIRFGNSEEVIIGEWAIAIGNPFGLFAIHSQPSVSVGVVSATNRDFDRNQEGRLYQNMVQTDAAINRGNSGGPLVNAAGELIGMNTMIFTENGGGSIGLGFAIPSSKLKDLYEEIKDRGSVDHDVWLGLRVQDVNRLIAASLHLPEIRGAVVTDIEPGSPVDRAGIESPDVIVAVNGHEITNSRDLDGFLRNSDLRVGDKVKFSIYRSGKQIELSVKLTKRGD